MACARIPLPVPVSPVSSTGGVSSNAAIWRARSSTARTAGDSPTMVANPTSRVARRRDRKSTRLNSSHGYISYAVFCLKKKKKKHGGLTEQTIHEHKHI